MPALMKYYQRKDFFGTNGAAFVMAKIGAPAVPFLVDRLREKDEDVRWRAAIDLERFGPVAKDAVPALKDMLKESSAKLRIEAASALWQIARDPDAIVSLCDSLKDSDEFIRDDAARAWGTSVPRREPLFLAWRSY